MSWLLTALEKTTGVALEKFTVVFNLSQDFIIVLGIALSWTVNNNTFVV